MYARLRGVNELFSFWNLGLNGVGLTKSLNSNWFDQICKLGGDVCYVQEGLESFQFLVGLDHRGYGEEPNPKVYQYSLEHMELRKSDRAHSQKCRLIKINKYIDEMMKVDRVSSANLEESK